MKRPVFERRPAVLRAIRPAPAAAPALMVLLLPILLFPACGPREEQVITDGTFLSLPIWDDGKAEVNFYKVHCLSCGIGSETLPEATFTLGSYLVKHDFNPLEMSKANPTDLVKAPCFKWAMFYEYGSKYTYQAKFSYVNNALQKDLRPVKQSFTSFDWCSNVYEELSIAPDGEVSSLYRSDDYGNRFRTFSYRPNAYTMEQIPFLIRALDFSEADRHRFLVMTHKGQYYPAVAILQGTEEIPLPAGEAGSAETSEEDAEEKGAEGTEADATMRTAEKILVRYVPGKDRDLFPLLASPIGRVAEQEETYWRGTDPERILLKMESNSYTMVLLDHVRTGYWSHDKEDFFNLLKNVADFP